MRLARLAVVAAAVFAVVCTTGCGDKKRFIGTWELDVSGLQSQLQQGGTYSMSMTFKQDGTGSMDMKQTIVQQMPQSHSERFDWKLKKGKLVLSVPSQGVTQEFGYKFSEQGGLTLTSGQGRQGQSMRFTRAK